MNVETLHDALTLLPADLVAEAGRYRGGKGPVIRWQRYAAMAACLAVILGCTLLFRQGLPSAGGKGTANDMAAPRAMATQTPTGAVPETAAGVPEAQLEMDMGPAAKATQNQVLEGPPQLTLTSGQAELTLPESGCTWDLPREEGAFDTICACGGAPTDDPDSLPLLEAETSLVQLTWDPAPESCTILYYASEASEPQSIPTSEGSATLEQGGIYEVTAHWSQGTATYLFRMNANWEG